MIRNVELPTGEVGGATVSENFGKVKRLGDFVLASPATAAMAAFIRFALLSRFPLAIVPTGRYKSTAKWEEKRLADISTRDGSIAVCLWFDDQAETAVDHYLEIFKDGRRAEVFRRSEEGAALTVAFELRGRRFIALNGGPHFKFTPAVSLVVDCADQAEIDYFWQRLSEGGAPSRCGWLQDKFGLSWQVVPRDLSRLISRGPAVMQALMKMDKLDIAALERAGNTGEETRP